MQVIKIYKNGTEHLLVTVNPEEEIDSLSEDDINSLKDVFNDKNGVKGLSTVENLKSLHEEGILEQPDYKCYALAACESLNEGWYSIEDEDGYVIKPLPDIVPVENVPASTKSKKAAAPVTPALAVDPDKLSRLKEVEAELASLVSRSAEIPNEISNVESQLADLQSRLDDLRQEETTTRSQIADLTDEASELQKGTEELKTQVLTQIQSLQEQMAQLTGLAKLLGLG